MFHYNIIKKTISIKIGIKSLEENLKKGLSKSKFDPEKKWTKKSCTFTNT